MRTSIVVGAIAAALAAAAVPAHAMLTFVDSNTGGIGEVNILFQAKEEGGIIHGQVDHTGAGVTFDSLTSQTLDQVAQGQADIFCANPGCVDNSSIHKDMGQQLSSIEMKAGLLNGQPTAWTDVILNDNNGTGTALITAMDNTNHSFTDVLKPGQNFVTIQAVAGSGEFITDVTVQNDAAGAAFGFNDFKQPRVSGLCVQTSPGSCTTVPVPTPEPASVVLLGAGLVGLGLVRWRVRS